MNVRELDEVTPSPTTREKIMMHGLHEIAMMAPGSHLSDPAYSARRKIKEYAQRILDAMEDASDGSCVIRLSHPEGTPATWVNAYNTDHIVCDYHKRQHNNYNSKWEAILKDTLCTAKIRPFPDDTEFTCSLGDHGLDVAHKAVIKNAVNPDGWTDLVWFEEDRRNFRGGWANCTSKICVLPEGHHGNHAVK
jgi:hypothetical protein